MFGLISAGLGIAQGVMGTIGAAKGLKGGDDEGGGEAKAAKKNEGAAKGGEAKEAQAEENAVDKLLGALNSPNVRSVNDIKNVRDQIMQKLGGQGLDGEKMDSARKKLNQATLKKLGIGNA